MADFNVEKREVGAVSVLDVKGFFRCSHSTKSGKCFQQSYRRKELQGCCKFQ